MSLESWCGHKRAWILILLALLVVTYQGFRAAPILFRGFGTPFLGFQARPVEKALTVTRVFEASPEGRPTPAFLAGLEEGDRPIRIRNAAGSSFELKGPFDTARAIRSIRPGAPWEIAVLRPDRSGGLDEHLLRMPAAPVPTGTGWVSVRDFSSNILLPMVCLAVALFIGLARIDDPRALIASLLFFSFTGAAWEGGYALFPPGFREAGLVLVITLFSCWSYLFMRFFLVYPSPSPIDRRWPRLKRFLLAFPALFSLWNIFWMHTLGTSYERYAEMVDRFLWIDITLDVVFVLLFAVGFVSLIWNILVTTAKNDRRRLMILLIGSAGILPGLTLYVCRVILHWENVPVWLYYTAAATLGLFPLSFAYAVVKHRVFGIRLILRRGLQYALLSRGFLAAEGILVFYGLFYGLAPLLDRWLHGSPTSMLALTTALATMGVVLVLKRLNHGVMAMLDRKFFREAYDVRRILLDLSKAVRRLATEPHSLLRLVSTRILDTLHPSHVAVYLKGEELLRFPIQNQDRTRDLRELARRHQHDYVCFWRSDASYVPGREAPWVPEEKVLPADSMTARRLIEDHAGEAYALEVHPDDPRSWTPPRDRNRGTASVAMDGPLLAGNQTRLIVPLVTQDRTMGFLSLGEKQSEEPYTREDKDLLLTVAQQVALALDYAEFIRNEAEQINLRREVEIAKKVQERLFPQQVPKIDGLDTVGHCRPARWVGGDYYDLLELDSRSLGVALGDVAGKGMSAALLMASLQAMLRIHADAHRGEPHRLASEINVHLCRTMDSNRFASLFYGEFDCRSKRFTYINAGHNPPLLIRPGERKLRSVGARAAEDLAPQAAAEVQVLRLKATGMVLGAFGDASYRQSTMDLLPGDILVLYTDGITEAMNAGREEYGEGRLQKLLRRNARLTPHQIRDLILSDVERFTGGASQEDDQTLIVIRVGEC